MQTNLQLREPMPLLLAQLLLFRDTCLITTGYSSDLAVKMSILGSIDLKFYMLAETSEDAPSSKLLPACAHSAS